MADRRNDDVNIDVDIISLHYHPSKDIFFPNTHKLRVMCGDAVWPISPRLAIYDFVKFSFFTVPVTMFDVTVCHCVELLQYSVGIGRVHAAHLR